MIKVNIVCVGKVKEKYFSEAVSEYAKRLSRYCQFNIKEVKEENYVENPDSKEILSILKKEGENVIKELKGTVVIMDILSKQYSSSEFSSFVSKMVDSGEEITFVIGGSYGLSEDVKKLAKHKISFSNMTFPHTLFRVMLVEQIYRAFMIMNNSKYHK